MLIKILNSFYGSIFSVLELVSFFNTINYSTTQMNNETSFENTTTKGSKCKRVRVRKCHFWCRRLVCLVLEFVGSVSGASSSVFFSEGVPSRIRSSGCERGLSGLLARCSLTMYVCHWSGLLAWLPTRLVLPCVKLVAACPSVKAREVCHGRQLSAIWPCMCVTVAGCSCDCLQGWFFRVWS